MYLLQFNRKGDIYKDDDGCTAVPEFFEVLNTEKLGATALKWVALVCDYDSPYRNFVDSERARAVSRDLYGDYDWKGAKHPKVLAAMDKYKSLQFDPLDQQLQAFNKKITQFTQFMDNMSVNADTAVEMQKIMIGIDKMLNTRQHLIDAIEKRGKRQKIQGGKELSFLEQRQENLKTDS
jgi:hypothetical protein